MAKKKPKKTTRKPSTPPKRRPHEAPLDLPDPRALEGAISDVVDKAKGDAQTPLQQAQALVYQAFDQRDERKKCALAQEALELSIDCADAFVLLAEHAETRREALALYRQAVKAGERALGPDVFKDAVGKFWRLEETRPYMRARMGLAELLWTSGERGDAIDHLKEMLRLNENDNQGVRYVLSGWLLNMDRFDELAALLKEYDEPTAAWAYTKALLGFRRDGDTTATRKLLKAARAINKHVPAYLLGTRPMPRDQPPLYGLGDENEAILYAASAMGGWKTIPGAIAWLKGSTRKPRAKKDAPIRAKGPLPLVKARLKRAPQEYDVWQAEVREFGGRIAVHGDLVHPWLVIVGSRSTGTVLAQTLTETLPPSALVWDQLVEAILAPMAGTPHRPTLLQVRDDAPWIELKADIEETGISVETSDELDFIDFVLEELRKDLASEQPPGLLEMPGVDPQKLARFYQAAADFYRRAPWRKLGYESAIKIECASLESGPRYAVVMGQSGLTFGLALYDELMVLKRLWSNNLSDEENARETVALTVTYDDEAGVGDADLDAIEQYDWEIAGAEAFPAIFRKERGMSMRPPLGWELELMEACLRAIPDFVDTHPLDNLSRHEIVIATASGEQELALSWVDD